MNNKTINDFDIFTKVKDSLLNQNCQSLSKTGDCSYRGLHGEVYEKIESEVEQSFLKEHGITTGSDYYMTDDYFTDIEDLVCNYIKQMDDNDPRLQKCAAGFLIKNDYYNFGLEGNSIEDQLVWDAIVKSNPEWDCNNDSRSMVWVTQRIHDILSPEKWKAYFNSLSNYFTIDHKFDVVKFLTEFAGIDRDKTQYEMSYKHDDLNSAFEGFRHKVLLD